MFIDQVQKAVTYIREINEIGLYATMIDSRLFTYFKISPVFYIVLPFLAVLLSINALITGIQLVQADNKNLDRLIRLLSSLISAVLASCSLYGAAFSMITGYTFAAGPWFFLSSLLVVMAHQFIIMGINIKRFRDASHNSVQKYHYLQEIVNTFYVLCVLGSALGATVFVMFLPAAFPLIGATFSVLTILLIAIGIGWRIIPENWKILTKNSFNLTPPETEPSIINVDDLLAEAAAVQKPVSNCHLFSTPDYSSMIKQLSIDDAEKYLTIIISRKIEVLQKSPNLHTSKLINKIDLLTELLASIDLKQDKTKLVKKYPLAFQSFLTEKGEVEQIVDAQVVLHAIKYHKKKEYIAESTKLEHNYS